MSRRVGHETWWKGAVRLSHKVGYLIFFFNDTATTEIYTLSLHDALPISSLITAKRAGRPSNARLKDTISTLICSPSRSRSEEHTSELQSQSNLVCRLLLEKKK